MESYLWLRLEIRYFLMEKICQDDVIQLKLIVQKEQSTYLVSMLFSKKPIKRDIFIEIIPS